MNIETAIIFEHYEGWVIMAHFGEDIKDLWIPCDNLESAIRYLAASQCDKLTIKFLNGSSLDVDHNTLEVR